jgi:hypothetical protein
MSTTKDPGFISSFSGFHDLTSGGRRAWKGLTSRSEDGRGFFERRGGDVLKGTGQALFGTALLGSTVASFAIPGSTLAVNAGGAALRGLGRGIAGKATSTAYTAAQNTRRGLSTRAAKDLGQRYVQKAYNPQKPGGFFRQSLGNVLALDSKRLSQRVGADMQRTGRVSGITNARLWAGQKLGMSAHVSPGRFTNPNNWLPNSRLSPLHREGGNNWLQRRAVRNPYTTDIAVTSTAGIGSSMFDSSYNDLFNNQQPAAKPPAWTLPVPASIGFNR